MTIATMPAFTAAGRWSHAATTIASPRESHPYIFHARHAHICSLGVRIACLFVQGLLGRPPQVSDFYEMCSGCVAPMYGGVLCPWGFKSPLRHRLRPTRKAHIPCTNPTQTHSGGVSSLPSGRCFTGVDPVLEERPPIHSD